MPPVKLEGSKASLLILPPLPSPLKRAPLWTAYKTTFETLLPKVLPQDKQYVSRLDVAVCLPSNRPTASRTAHYQADQLIFQEVYTLVCLAATRTKVELDFPGGVDVRIFLIDDISSSQASGQPVQKWLAGPVIDLYTLANSRTYPTIYGVESEQGEAVLQPLLHAYKNTRKQSPTVHRLPGGPLLNLPTSTEAIIDKQVNVHHDVINGGTFDHLHIGHKLLLTATVYLSDPEPSTASRSITIGTTGDELLTNKKHQDHLESWDTRQQRTHEFIESILFFHPASNEIKIHHESINKPGPNGRTERVTYTSRENKLVVNYTQISDPYGPTITVEHLSALIISAETRAGGKAVNDKRREKGWTDLEVFEVGVIDAVVDEDEVEAVVKDGFDGKLSSTGMRKRLALVEQDQMQGQESNGKNSGKL